MNPINPFSRESTRLTSYTEYRFDFFGESVGWRIRQVQEDADYYFTILCEHSIFLKYFQQGGAKLPALYQISRDRFIERSDRLFFRNLIDSCDIS